jgi:hypothetical protein
MRLLARVRLFGIHLFVIRYSLFDKPGIIYFVCRFCVESVCGVRVSSPCVESVCRFRV